MSAQPESGQAELTGNVMFYKQPEPLSLERHRSLGAKRVDRPFQFLGASHVVPITVNEFGVAAGSYPVIFAGEKKTPLAVMGIRGGENVFVDRTGEIDPEIYLPAFVRRYPFVFASDGQNERLLVCIDRAAPMIGENPEVPFFNGDEPSQYTQDAIEFCKEFERHRLATEAFVKTIDELGLFEEKDITLSQNLPDGKQEQARIADYFAISEEKLNALPIDKVQMLREQGMYGPIYAHLISLLSWPKIINRGLTIANAEMQAQTRANTPLA
ncbi:MAG: SapC family protein [Pseudomonadota bacterium]